MLKDTEVRPAAAATLPLKYHRLVPKEPQWNSPKPVRKGGPGGRFSPARQSTTVLDGRTFEQMISATPS